MSTSFERFIAGEDRLSAVLRALPQYEPDSALAARFAEAARSAQAQSVAPLAFEPPPALDAEFKRMATKIDTAQQGRRLATLRSIEAGTPVEQAMGGPVSEAAGNWLKQQMPATPPSPVRRNWLRLGWRDVQLVGLAAILAAWGTHFFLQRSPTSTEVVMLDAFRQASEASTDSTQDESSSLASKLEEAIQANLHQYAASPAPAIQEKRPSPRSTPARSPRKASGDEQGTSATTHPGVEQPSPREQPPLAAAAAAPEPTITSETTVPVQDERARAKTTPEPTVRLAEAPHVHSPAQSESINAPHAETRQLTTAHLDREPAVLMPAPVVRSAPPPNALHATLQDDPAGIATRLAATEGTGFTISCADPESQAVKTWVENLRHALQTRGEPPLIRVLKNTGLAEGKLLIQKASE